MNRLRFYMYDIARGAYLRPESFCVILRHAAKCGFTHFIPYLENMIRLSSMEKAACHCAYTQEDWRLFQKTADEAGIELVPHFNVIGHSNQICLAYPELTGCAGELSEEKKNISGQFASLADPFHFAELDPSTPVSQQWMLRCLKEFCAFSKSEYFLIGGDEWNIQKHLLKQKNFDAGIAWCDYMNLAVEYLVSQKRTPIIWHDMLVHYPGVLDRLSKKAVIGFWFYDYDSGYPFLRTLKEYGFRTIMATGLCDGALSQRRKRALLCAVKEAEKYQADGFMVTTWMDGRFERQYANIELCGKLLEGKTIPDIYPETVSNYLYLNKIRGLSGEQHWKEALLKKLADPAWEKYPGYRTLLKDASERNTESLRKNYEVNHYPEGPLYETFRTVKRSAASQSEQLKLPEIPAGFRVELQKDPAAGNMIRFFNDHETFVLYPDYGARLQDWRTNSFSLIPDGIPAFLKKNPHQQPGSFKSYTSPGFLPMWDLGTHLNPDIIWNYPWDFRIDTSDPEEPAAEMYRKFPHAEIFYRVSVKRGSHGFRWKCRAVNLLPHISGAFGWNFLLAGDNVLESQFETEHISTVNPFESCTELPIFEGSALTIRNKNWCLKLETPPENSAGFWIDWGKGWMTPDLHGKYRALELGEAFETQWNFRLKEL